MHTDMCECVRVGVRTRVRARVRAHTGVRAGERVRVCARARVRVCAHGRARESDADGCAGVAVMCVDRALRGTARGGGSHGVSNGLRCRIGAATIHKADDRVLIPNLDRAMVMKCPSYTGETVTRDYEHTLLTTLSPEYNLSTHSREDFYKQEQFDDKRFYDSGQNKRQ